jgi:hypothetical protein
MDEDVLAIVREILQDLRRKDKLVYASLVARIRAKTQDEYEESLRQIDVMSEEQLDIQCRKYANLAAFARSAFARGHWGARR